MPLKKFAKALPCVMRTFEELEGWLQCQHLSIGTPEDVPDNWDELLAAQPSGYVMLSSKCWPRLVRRKGDDVEPFSFEQEMPKGQIIFVVGQAA